MTDLVRPEVYAGLFLSWGLFRKKDGQKRRLPEGFIRRIFYESIRNVLVARTRSC
jgi:hypothetical protein